MASSPYRKQLLSLIRRVAAPSHSGGRGTTSESLVSILEACRRSLASRESPLVPGTNFSAEINKCPGNAHHSSLLGSVASQESDEDCNAAKRIHRGCEGTAVSRHYVYYRGSEDSSAQLLVSEGFRDAADPTQYFKKPDSAAFDTLPILPCPTSSPSHIQSQLCAADGSELRRQEFCESIRAHCLTLSLGERLFLFSNAATVCQHSGSCCASARDSILGDVKRFDLPTKPLVWTNSHVINFTALQRERGNFFTLSYGFQSRLYSTTDQTIRSAPEQDDDPSREKDGRLLVGRKDGTPAGEKMWIQRVISRKLWPFVQLARLDKPIGTWLLVWPCFWSICLAAPSGSFPDVEILGWFGVGAILLRGAGCTINDLLDRDIDVKVERTQQRPIASGALTPLQGVSFLGCQLLLGLVVLLQLNDFSRVLGASSLLLVGTYPLMKRWTFWPQAYLGLTFNWGALLGWAAVHGNLDLSVVLPLYASGVCWTLVYDTIYAHQDKEDDLKVGVKSTALRFGNNTQIWLTGFSAACVGSLTLAGFNCELGWPFYAGMVATAGHFAWQVSSVRIHDRADCNSKFVSNKWFGAIVCSAIILGKLAAFSP